MTERMHMQKYSDGKQNLESYSAKCTYLHSVNFVGPLIMTMTILNPNRTEW
jgi:hypothetical protein